MLGLISNLFNSFTKTQPLNPTPEAEKPKNGLLNKSHAELQKLVRENENALERYQSLIELTEKKKEEILETVARSKPSLSDKRFARELSRIELRNDNYNRMFNASILYGKILDKIVISSEIDEFFRNIIDTQLTQSYSKQIEEILSKTDTMISELSNVATIASTNTKLDDVELILNNADEKRYLEEFARIRSLQNQVLPIGQQIKTKNMAEATN